MAAGSTHESICTIAMTLLGAEPVQDLDDDDSNEAVICKRVYPNLRRAYLSKYPWRFATKMQQLTREAANPDGPWLYQFRLPSDRLKNTPYRLYPNNLDGASPIRGFEDIGDKILSNQTELWMQYTFDVAPSEWPDYFEQFIANALAANTALAITRSERLREDFMQAAFGPGPARNRGLYQDAKTADSVDRPNRIVVDNSLAEARFGGVGSSFGDSII